MKFILTVLTGLIFGALLLPLVPRQDLPVTTDQRIDANMIAHQFGYTTYLEVK